MGNQIRHSALIIGHWLVFKLYLIYLVLLMLCIRMVPSLSALIMISTTMIVVQDDHIAVLEISITAYYI